MLNVNEITNHEAETHVLSCILIDPLLIALCILKPTHFYDLMFSRVYEAMLKIHKEGKQIDITILFQYMDDAVDMDYLYDLFSYAILPSGFEEHCAIVLENYNRRKIKKQAQKVIGLCEDKGIGYGKVISEAVAVSDTEEHVEANKLLPGVIETVDKLFEKHQSLMVSDTTGYYAIDSLIGGYRAGSLYIIGARPSVGKSTLAVNLALKLSEGGKRTALFSTEMPPHEIHIRMLSNLAQVESRMIEKGVDEIEDKITDAVTKMTSYAECHIHNSFSNESLERLISKETSQGAEVIFIDYLQNIKTEKQYGTRNDAIGAITAMLKSQALKYGISIVCLAQLNRQFQEGQEPELSHLRDSGNIEQDADVVMFLEGYDDYAQEINLYVKKNRHGELGKIMLKYIKKYFTFLNRNTAGDLGSKF